MAHINIKNIILIIGVTIFDVCVGFYDRLVNEVGIIKAITNNILPISSVTQSTEGFVAIKSIGTINPITLIIFVAIMLIIIFIVSCTCRGAAMA